MKTLNVKFLLLGLVGFLIFATSCEKDQVFEIEKEVDSLVGTWEVSEGNVIVYLDDIKAELDLVLSGDMNFKSNEEVIVDFTLSIREETERWALVDDEDDFKTIQFTIAVENSEVKFNLDLTREM